MPRSTFAFAFRLTLSLALILATFLVFAQTQSGGPKPASHPVKPIATAGASVQTFRNVGKAYFEQGKYVEAIEQLFWLDTRALDDRRLNAVWAEAKRHPEHGFFKRLHRAFGRGPKRNLNSRKVKFMLSALVLEFDKRERAKFAGPVEGVPSEVVEEVGKAVLGEELTAPDLLRLFHCVAADKSGG